VPVHGLDDACPACRRPSGDHTLREWAACMGESTELPYEPIPNDTAAAANAALRERFGLDDDLVVADNVVIRAATLDFSAGAIAGKMPALIHEFQTSGTGGPPVPVAKVVFVSPGDGMRRYGRLVRDSANGAANAAEGKRR
jgi:hypothetical protein